MMVTEAMQDGGCSGSCISHDLLVDQGRTHEIFTALALFDCIKSVSRAISFFPKTATKNTR
ncbi:hypothetical protein FQA45_14860 [Glutamicibacter halophytocola]|uniref:Isochorismatase family protein n=1 Tax=Glutamicibacter halophytocola TaxID=1933880 RepID=A0ABX5YCU0_9MICC|nr:hypothetical protein [Glutamicibacter halophytocola]QDY67482.1 hypothetical protein FQA45_14860 [Glutamicibacter halophytocola]